MKVVNILSLHGGGYMSLDQRSAAILTQLINANSYLSIKELTERLNVSRRTVYYEIEKINYWLEGQGLAKVQHIRSAGLLLDEKTKSHIPNKMKSLQVWHYEYSATERKAWLAIYLFSRDSALFLENLTERVRVSRNTTIDDLKVVKDELLKFNLDLEFERKTGYIIVGEESDKRKAIVYYLSLALPDQNWETLLSAIQLFLNAHQETRESSNLFTIEELKAVYSVISESEKELNIQYTDDVLHSLSLRLLLFGKRLSRGKTIEINPVEKQVLRETKEYEAAQFISGKLENIVGVPYPEDETLYITTHLLSAKVNYSKETIQSTNASKDLTEIISLMIDDFQKYACVLFENRDILEQNLLLHIRPAFYRMKYGLEVENKIVETIKSKYPEIFLITKKVMHYLEDFVGKPVHENEIAFIAMHFGGGMKREGIVPADRKKALIVCANGVGTSQILRQQLEGLFSTVDIVGTTSIREYEKKQYDIDFVISTTQIPKKKYPVFVVNPILTETEKERLLKNVNGLFESSVQNNFPVEGLLGLIRKHADIHDDKALYQELKGFLNKPAIGLSKEHKPNLSELLDKEVIQLVDEVKDWEEAIRLAAKPLLEKKSITEKYVTAMINNVLKLGPYIVIAPKFAIPHANPVDGVNQLGMSLLRLKQAVSFSDNDRHDVNIIVVLAAVDSERHLRALSQLTNLMSDPTVITNLILTKSTQEIVNLIQS